MVEATVGHAFPCNIDAALVDRLYRKLTIALGHEATAAADEAMEPAFVGISQASVLGRSLDSRNVFCSIRSTGATPEQFA